MPSRQRLLFKTPLLSFNLFTTLVEDIMHDKSPSLATLAISLLLAGCAAGPSDAEIKAAMEKSLSESLSPLRLLDKAMSAKLTAVKQIGCSKDKEGAAFVCDIQMTVETTNPLNGKVESKDSTDKLRLVKTDKGWTVSK